MKVKIRTAVGLATSYEALRVEIVCKN